MLIANLSDPHVRSPGKLYQGLVDSNTMFDAAVRHLNVLDPAPALVIVTGEIVDHGMPAEYGHARMALMAIRQLVLLCRHVHQFMLTHFAGTVLVTAPSTTTAVALQLALDADPTSFVEPPSFLLHRWRKDAGLLTHFVPIGGLTAFAVLLNTNP